MTNKKNLKEEFKDLDFDLTLIKIINEDDYETLDLKDFTILISEKLIKMYYSRDQEILNNVSEKILNHIKDNSGILSYIKGTRRVINFVETLKNYLPKWKSDINIKQLELFEKKDDSIDKKEEDNIEDDKNIIIKPEKKQIKDISSKQIKEIKKSMEELVDCVDYMWDIEISMGLKPLDVKIMIMKAKNLLEVLDPNDPIVSNLPKLNFSSEVKTINYENEGEYIGEIKNGLRHGKGKMTYDNGNIYSGEWVNDLFEGKGTYLIPNGQSSKGEWENGYLIKGEIIYIKGVINDEKYIGELVYSFLGYPVPHGMGAYFYINGDKYVGEFVDYKKEGKGTFTWANGDSYCGYWQNDNYHGKGILNKNGIIRDGNWVEGKFVEK